MSSLVNMQTGPAQNQPVTPQTVRPPSPVGSMDPIFLMINSLETGGGERQFVELARSLRADHLQVHLGCLLKKGAFLEGLGELHHFGLGGSLYGVQSISSHSQNSS